MRRRLTGVVMMVVVMLSGAATATAASYNHVLSQNMRIAQRFSFETFRADIIWAVVALTPEMLEALWKRETDISEKPAELESQVVKASQVRGTQFLLFMYAPEPTSVFTTEDKSFWQLKLDKGDAEYQPVAIDPVENSVMVSRLFAFNHKWAKIYLVTFNGDYQPPFNLRMVGASGKSTIKWK